MDKSVTVTPGQITVFKIIFVALVPALLLIAGGYFADQAKKEIVMHVPAPSANNKWQPANNKYALPDPPWPSKFMFKTPLNILSHENN